MPLSVQSVVHSLSLPATLTFLKRVISDPSSVGAIAPSSRWLCRRMAEQVDITRPGMVVELGAGTGALTRMLLKRGLPASRLAIIELDATMCDYLREHFPEVQVIHGDALAMDQLLVQHGIATLNAVVSSLPLLLFPTDARRSLIANACRMMGDGGAFIQFTYGYRPLLDESELAAEQLTASRAGGRIWRNLPPAVVWRFVQDDSLS